MLHIVKAVADRAGIPLEDVLEAYRRVPRVDFVKALGVSKGTAVLLSESLQLTEVKDIEDYGGRGKKYERAFAACLKAVGLKFKENGLIGTSGALWDFQPTGPGWDKRIGVGTKHNLKVLSSRALFTSAELRKMVPIGKKRGWKGKTGEALKKKVMAWFKRIGLPTTRWLRAKSRSVEDRIIKAAASKNMKAAALKALVPENFGHDVFVPTSVDFFADKEGSLSGVKVKGKWQSEEGGTKPGKLTIAGRQIGSTLTTYARATKYYKTAPTPHHAAKAKPKAKKARRK